MMPCLIAAIGLGLLATPAAQDESPNPAERAVREVDGRLVAAFNGGDAEAVAAVFAPQAELVDEAGNVYRGREAIAALLARFFEQYPNVTLELATETARPIGPSVVIADGLMTFKARPAADGEGRGEDGPATAVVGYTHVYVDREGDWLIASARHSTEDPAPRPAPCSSRSTGSSASGSARIPTAT